MTTSYERRTENTRMQSNTHGYDEARARLQAAAADAIQFLLQEKGLVYEEKHEGWYSVTDEAFYPQSAVQPYLDPPTGRKMMVWQR